MTIVKVFRCLICGDPYIGFEKPKNCPFCGAHERFLVPAENWKPLWGGELSETSKKNIEQTLDLEVGATALYKCISEKVEDEFYKGMWKALKKVENEHAVVCRKFLGLDSLPTKEEPCTENVEEMLKQTLAKEEHATSLYKKFTEESTEENVKTFFVALTEVETDHIDLAKEKLGQ